ncbi:MAG: polysaccharide deacetylase family protein [Bacteroidales bacterium]|nr:polysaccharide deacetylase family protein [Bacteroidales bacterium]
MAQKHLNHFSLFTNDVETTSVWFNSLRDETGLMVIKEGMPLLLDIYQEYKIQSTFFFNGDIVKLAPDVVKMILPFGHEVGSHGMSHRVEDGFDLMDLRTQIRHLSESKNLLEGISGREVISFRAPALRTNKYTGLALVETGYKVDSSVASTRFDAFMSFGSSKKLKWLTAPRVPYRTRRDDLTKKGEDGVIEIPLSATFFPYVGTTMRIFPRLTSLQHNLLNLETKRINNKPIVFDIHPNEFIDESEGERYIERRSKGILSYLIKDLLRSRLKTNNLGTRAIPLYKKEIEFFLNEGYIFTTVQDYCIQNKLL